MLFATRVYFYSFSQHNIVTLFMINDVGRIHTDVFCSVTLYNVDNSFPRLNAETVKIKEKYVYDNAILITRKSIKSSRAAEYCDCH